MMVLTGLDVLRQRGFDLLEGRRVGLLTNPSGVTHDLRSAYELLAHAPGVTLAAIFSPEHGFAAAAADGEHVASSVDACSGAVIHSLYGAAFKPTREMLDGLDTIVCDLQDIGARYYTYAWTLSYVLEAAGESQVEVMILDRPNPLADTVDGPLIEPGRESLVGRAPVPIQHGMTLGELMRMFNALWNPTPAPLTVIECRGYHRAMGWEETGLLFVPPSPAMPHISTARHYPGACLLEGTNLSEGRGTALPFEIVGAPYLDGVWLAERLNGLGLPGVRFRPHVFKPSASKHCGQVCQGVQAHITDDDYRPLVAWLAVIRELRQHYETEFGWLLDTFDRLIGSSAVRQQIDAGATVGAITADWDEIAALFRIERDPFLLYRAGET